jgi:hypothetical protein
VCIVVTAAFVLRGLITAKSARNSNISAPRAPLCTPGCEYITHMKVHRCTDAREGGGGGRHRFGNVNFKRAYVTTVVTGIINSRFCG